MRKVLFTLCLASTLGTVSAQSGYDFSYKTGQPYTPLTAGTDASAGTIWFGENTSIPLPFALKIADKTVNDFFMVNGIAMPATDTTGVVSGFIPLGGILLVDKGLATGTHVSPVRYVTEGTSPNRIFKLEYFNAGFANEFFNSGTFDDSVNYQVWAYETSNIIEFHYGDHRITGTDYFELGDGPIAGYLKNLDMEEDTFSMFYYTKGAPTAPTFDSTNLDEPETLDEMPAKGIVYRFTPQGSAVSAGEQELLQKFTVFPTRTGSTLYINNTMSMSGTIEIYSLTGQLAASSVALAPGRNQIDVSSLAPAMYLLKINTAQGSAVYRFIRE